MANVAAGVVCPISSPAFAQTTLRNGIDIGVVNAEPSSNHRRSDRKPAAGPIGSARTLRPWSTSARRNACPVSAIANPSGPTTQKNLTITARAQ